MLQAALAVFVKKGLLTPKLVGVLATEVSVDWLFSQLRTAFNAMPVRWVVSAAQEERRNIAGLTARCLPAVLEVSGVLLG